MRLARDIWRVAVVAAPIETVLRAGTLEGLPVHPLPEEGAMRFLADPFARWHEGRLHVLAEAYDYRTRRGAIDALVLDEGFAVTARRRVLDEPWHLSYPVTIEDAGAVWMLPEAHRSGRATLYRACAFPWEWQAAAVLPLHPRAVDATPFRHDGLWWIVYAVGDSLHAVHAERLDGPWRAHEGGALRTGAAGSRPGGTPAVVDGRLVLPVQDCRRTYGAAIRPLTVERLTPNAFDAALGPPIVAPAALRPYTAGLHTLAAAGPVTLIDAKRIELSPRSLAVLATRGLRRRDAAARR